MGPHEALWGTNIRGRMGPHKALTVRVRESVCTCARMHKRAWLHALHGAAWLVTRGTHGASGMRGPRGMRGLHPHCSYSIRQFPACSRAGMHAGSLP